MKYNFKIFLILVFLIKIDLSISQSSNQAIYEEPFDLASGGASLTWPSQEGIIYANPATMPLGEISHRWLGSQFSLFTSKDSIDLIQKLQKSKDLNTVLPSLLGSSLHGGFSATVSYIYKYIGMSTLYNVSFDIEGKKIGASGIPSFDLRARLVNGTFFSFGGRPFRWFLIGATVKYYSSFIDIDKEYAITDAEVLAEEFANPETLSPSQGVGGDLGMLFFFQGKKIDTRFALKADNLGTTKLTGGSVTSLKQMYHVGIGTTIHGKVEAWHLAIDYRDIQNSLKEKLFKKIYLGSKLLFRNHIGLAFGLYQGRLSYGIRLDAYLFQIGFTQYGKELGSYPGEKLREIYLFNIAFGF